MAGKDDWVGVGTIGYVDEDDGNEGKAVLGDGLGRVVFTKLLSTTSSSNFFRFIERDELLLFWNWSFELGMTGKFCELAEGDDKLADDDDAIVDWGRMIPVLQEKTFADGSENREMFTFMCLESHVWAAHKNLIVHSNLALRFL